MRIVFAAAIIALSACNYGELRRNTVPPPEQVRHRDPTILGDASSEDEEVIKDALKRLPYAVVDAVTRINVWRDDEHFRRVECPGVDLLPLPIGHNCKKAGEKSRGIICIRKIWVGDYLVWHEATHCYDLWLMDQPVPPGKKFFRKAWLEVAGEHLYDREYAEPESDGFLTGYSRKSPGEDIAEWVEECLGYLYHPENRKESPLTRNAYLKTDVRYRKKLDLLHEYGFLLDSQYEQLKPLFQ